MTAWTLGVEASAGPGSIALLRDAALVAERGLAGQRASGLVPAAEALLSEAKIRPADLALLAVDVGPGSFTGTRVAVAFAKALAYACGSPLAAVSSLQARAYDAWRRGERGPLAVSLDARRGQRYGAAFQLEDAGVTRVLEDGLFPPERLESYAVRLGDADPAPSAEAVARLGMASSVRPTCFALAPVYLRAVEAQEKRRA